MSNAAILCPGPSLFHVNEDWSRFDFIVGVTDGILKEGVPFDAWSFQESCGHPQQIRYQRYGPIVKKLDVEVWALERLAQRWIHHWRLSPHKVKTDLQLKPDRGSGYYAFWRTGELGFQRIEVFGADMEGNSNYDPRTGEPFPRTMSSDSIEEEANWTRRWMKERKAFEGLAASLSRHGTELVRRSSVPDPL